MIEPVYYLIFRIKTSNQTSFQEKASALLALSVNASVSQSAENADKDMVIGGPATFEKNAYLHLDCC